LIELREIDRENRVKTEEPSNKIEKNRGNKVKSAKNRGNMVKKKEEEI